MPKIKRYEQLTLTLDAAEVENILRDYLKSAGGYSDYATVGKARPVISGGIATPPELSGYSFVIEEGKQ